MAEKRSSRDVVTIDPSLEYRRMLHFQERHSGWVVFRAVYWGMFVFIVGILMLAHIGTSNMLDFYGWVAVIFSLFFMIFGFATVLHLKLMKKYG